jgi:Helix-hairpin-helix domain
MPPTFPQPDREVLAGVVERVTFHNADSGFCVLRVKARGHRDLATIVGHAATISAGEWITASDDGVNDHVHGQQFKARFMRTSAPSSIDGIEKYLASGMIHGIGPVYARKMVRAFGEKVFDIIEAEPDRLREVDGIGPVRARRITAAWAEQKIIREIMVFLHSHGVGTARAVRIYKTYGVGADRRGVVVRGGADMKGGLVVPQHRLPVRRQQRFRGRKAGTARVGDRNRPLHLGEQVGFQSDVMADPGIVHLTFVTQSDRLPGMAQEASMLVRAKALQAPDGEILFLHRIGQVLLR